MNDNLRTRWGLLLIACTFNVAMSTAIAATKAVEFLAADSRWATPDIWQTMLLFQVVFWFVFGLAWAFLAFGVPPKSEPEPDKVAVLLEEIRDRGYDVVERLDKLNERGSR